MSKKCGLLGKRLGHSYSARIHELLGDYSYEYFERDEEDVRDFILGGDFDGINVTVPYKKTVIPYLDVMSERAREIGAVNTVYRSQDGRLIGENTDYAGLSYMLSRAGFDIKGKKVLILGSGGASATAQYLCRTEGACEYVTISRSGENNYSNIARHYDAHYIINTTPVGMYPNNDGTPLSLDGFDSLVGVADVIYNPRTTRLCYEAQMRSVPTTSGLSMLVAQAKAASECFMGVRIDDSVIEDIIRQLERESENIILVGMPGCGKSKVSCALAELLSREVIDTDAVVERESGSSIPDIFREEGEGAVRDMEHSAVCGACALSGRVIATGGGVPTFERNIMPMRQNGRVVYLRRPTHELSRGGRPLSEGADMDEMFRVRRPHYEGCADVTVDVRENPEATAQAIIDELYGGK